MYIHACVCDVVCPRRFWLDKHSLYLHIHMCDAVRTHVSVTCIISINTYTHARAHVHDVCPHISLSNGHGSLVYYLIISSHTYAYKCARTRIYVKTLSQLVHISLLRTLFFLWFMLLRTVFFFVSSKENQTTEAIFVFVLSQISAQTQFIYGRYSNCHRTQSHGRHLRPGGRAARRQ
jgi:hypothetical protein